MGLDHWFVEEEHIAVSPSPCTTPQLEQRFVPVTSEGHLHHYVEPSSMHLIHIHSRTSALEGTEEPIFLLHFGCVIKSSLKWPRFTNSEAVNASSIVSISY